MRRTCTKIHPLLGCNKREDQDIADKDVNHPFTDGESKNIVSLLDEEN